MRVTQGMLSNSMLHNLSNSQQRMQEYMQQVYTGKKISRPSQDPVIAVKGINYRKQVSQLEQFKNNAGEIHNWLDNSDAALDRGSQTLQRIRELAVKASNDHNGEKELESIRKEIYQLREHLVEVANTNVNGKYIFNGTNIEEAPVTYERDDDGNVENIIVEHNTESFEISISHGSKIQVNVNPENIFSQDLFDDIDKLMDRLEGEISENNEKISESIEELDGHINEMIDARSDVGAKMNRLELIEDRIDEQNTIATRMMSENEDVHMEEAITNLITQEILHRAALATGARIIQPTLIDFLR